MNAQDEFEKRLKECLSRGHLASVLEVQESVKTGHCSVCDLIDESLRSSPHLNPLHPEMKEEGTHK